MANVILEGTDSQGGFLVPDEVREALVTKFNGANGIASLVPAEQTVGKRAVYPVFAGRPSVSVVTEGGVKPVTDASFSSLTVNIKKFTALTLYTEEVLEDAKVDPTVLVNNELEVAFAKAVDAHALGYSAGTAITGAFDVELTNTTQTTELGTGNDAIAIAISAAMGQIESNGYTPNGIIIASDLRGSLRDARDGDGRPLYGQGGGGFAGTPSDLYGMNLTISSNLDALPAAAGKVAAIVGDFTSAKLLMRKDLTTKVSTQATVVDGGTTHNLFQENKVAVLWEMRVGFNVLELNKSFAVITNAA